MTHSFPHFFTTGHGKDVAIIGDFDQTVDYATEHFIQTAKSAIQAKDSFFVALSGGSTPNAIYKKLASEKSKELDWSKVFLFWSDERAVPPTSDESNFFCAMNAGLKRLPLVKEHVLRMHAESDIEKHAEHYEALLKSIMGPRPFDLVMLGMGEDGHTASLFPGTKALDEQQRWVVANHVPQKNCWRMTMTYPCINRSKAIAVYVLGEAKQERIHAALVQGGSPAYPIENVGTEQNKALFILDEAAGAFFRKNKGD